MYKHIRNSKFLAYLYFDVGQSKKKINKAIIEIYIESINNWVYFWKLC